VSAVVHALEQVLYLSAVDWLTLNSFPQTVQCLVTRRLEPMHSREQ
jgi:hypothetical protein